MTSFQQNRSRILGVLVGLGLLFFLFVKGFWNPLQEQNKALLEKQTEYDDKHRELTNLLREKRKLDRSRLLGLPANVDRGGSEYAHYLKDMLRDSGLAIDVLQGPTGGDAKGQTQQPGKKAGHLILSYQVRARGDWSSVVSFLEKFQRTPLLQRIKSFNFERQDAGDTKGKLTLDMNIEAMVVGRSEQRPDNLMGVDRRALAIDAMAGLRGAPTGWSLLLRAQALILPELPDRNYNLMARKNPFTGELPPPPPPPVAKKPPPPPPPPPPDVEVLQYLRLVLTNVGEQKATLRNLLVNVSEREAYHTWSSIPGSGYNTFQILDEDRLNVMLRGTVLRVDQRDVYFKVGEKYFGIHLDQNLREALKTPLESEEIAKLGLGLKTNWGRPEKSFKTFPETREGARDQKLFFLVPVFYPGAPFGFTMEVGKLPGDAPRETRIKEVLPENPGQKGKFPPTGKEASKSQELFFPVPVVCTGTFSWFIMNVGGQATDSPEKTPILDLFFERLVKLDQFPSGSMETAKGGKVIFPAPAIYPGWPSWLTMNMQRPGEKGSRETRVLDQFFERLILIDQFPSVSMEAARGRDFIFLVPAICPGASSLLILNARRLPDIAPGAAKIQEDLK